MLLAGLLACWLVCLLVICLHVSGLFVICLLACLLVGLAALSFDLILDFSPLQSTRRLSVRSDPHAESVAHTLMPASYAAAHAEPKEHRADRTQLLVTQWKTEDWFWFLFSQHRRTLICCSHGHVGMLTVCLLSGWLVTGLPVTCLLACCLTGLPALFLILKSNFTPPRNTGRLS